MGKKYIIELESGTHIFVLGPEGIVHIGEPDVVYETVDGMQIGDAVINAKPYTEPDLEQVRKEAYDEGYDDAKGGYENGFENGMIVAWEAARKIWKYDTTTLRAIFGEGIMRMDWFINITASEAIEKIRAYEQEKEEIEVGDEVVHHIPNDGLNPAYGEKAIALTSSNDTAFYVLYNDGCATEIDPEQVIKTGRHFPEIAAVLKNMRGEQDG